MFRDNNFIRLYQLCRRAYGRYKWQLFGFVILSSISGVLEGVGINAIIPALSFLNVGVAAGEDIISRSIASFFGFLGVAYTLKNLFIFMIALFLSKAAILFWATSTAAKIYCTYERETRSDLLRMTLRADWPHLSQQKMGYLDQVLITDVNQSSNLLAYLNTAFISVVNLTVYTFLAINISAVVALLALALGGVIFLVFKPLFYQSKVLSGKIQGLYKELAHFINESITGIKTIKATMVEQPVLERGIAYAAQLQKHNVQIVKVRNITNVLLQPIGLLFIMAIFTYFYKWANFNFASLVVIIYAINKIFAYIQLAQSQMHGLNSFIPYLASIEEYKNSIAASLEVDEGIKPFLFERALRFHGIGFSYDADTIILKNVNFELKKGEMVGLIGPSGAGKTTVVDLILRLLRPDQGEIILDDVDISEIKLTEWRASVGYVSQDIFLMNDTIANNIKFYSPLDHAEVVAAAKMAHIDEFIETLPQKYETIVGERGLRLSGGQRQRIILARVLARKPKLLVLDEATSALDNESEVLIQKSIMSLRGKITVLAIAHRLSTIESADRLVVLEGGRISEEGKPAELLKDSGSYFFKVYNLRDGK